MPQSVSISAARLPDGRLQVVTGGMQTRWKVATTAGSSWSTWGPFPTAGLPSYATQWFGTGFNEIYQITSVAAVQLMTASGSTPNAGRLQVFACDAAASGYNSSDLGLYVTTKSSEEPNASWLPWSNPTYPVQESSDEVYSANQLAVVPLADGRLQLWVSVINDDENPPALYSCVQNAVTWNAPLFSNWTPFALGTSFGVQEPFPTALLNPVTASFLNNNFSEPGFQAQIWLPTNPIITSQRQSASATGELTNPLAGWSPWSEFAALAAIPEDAYLIPVQAASDGQGRTYLWLYSNNSSLAPGTGPWYYIYSLPDPPYWTTLFDFNVPDAASAIGLSSQPIYNNVIAAAPLPSGSLQMFYIDISGQVWTSWQEAVQSNGLPVAWSAWETF
ncbi:MAG: hypothetical protein ABSE51_02230 [Terracidiphilus sp.]